MSSIYNKVEAVVHPLCNTTGPTVSKPDPLIGESPCQVILEDPVAHFNLAGGRTQ